MVQQYNTVGPLGLRVRNQVKPDAISELLDAWNQKH